MDKSESAIEKFSQKMNCSQCVLSTFSEELGIDKELAIRIASGFGGGMCQGNVCGAVTGAIMALSLKYGNSNPEDKEAKEKVYRAVREISEEFKRINGSIKCCDLLGLDLMLEENKDLARKNGLFEEKCPKLIKDSISILEKLL